MDNQDKIFDKFKEAAHNSELKDFPGMEKVWSRVEDKLDKKEDKKAISLWKKIAIAASLLLIISVGSQFLKSDKVTTIPNQKVVVNDDKTIQNVVGKDNAVVEKDSKMVSKEEAVQILNNQVKNQQKVAINEIQLPISEAVGAGTSSAQEATADFMVAPVQAEAEYSKDDNSDVKGKIDSEAYSDAKERESAKVSFAAKRSASAPMPKKNAPLIILNGTAMAHSDEAKKDKMMSAELPNLNPENVESLVILDEPLYIIDGIYYSENDLYGPNPTSPYAPLDKQEIKTITILQDLEATSKYGEKGKKGVVIITTKTGKPVNKK
ncbi:hypothetical protein IRZ71_17230 [Flavobacterium sp. ANB]|uniref:hypothetical protein n=1 Tax=unclassified Flavobacterium TaxID=196869 RepID=UPI0012B6B1EF|nr:MULTISPECIES: hypothetical protein [unclassified Flavobacterium]MBF4518111.1 hypothetical protein [Flavobacterium sp. ANB]MTD71145.1 hypothetical protein [Flavobacterium sp. LC2016-13]